MDRNVWYPSLGLLQIWDVMSGQFNMPEIILIVFKPNKILKGK